MFTQRDLIKRPLTSPSLLCGIVAILSFLWFFCFGFMVISTHFPILLTCDTQLDADSSFLLFSLDFSILSLACLINLSITTLILSRTSGSTPSRDRNLVVNSRCGTPLRGICFPLPRIVMLERPLELLEFVLATVLCDQWMLGKEPVRLCSSSLCRSSNSQCAFTWRSYFPPVLVALLEHDFTAKAGRRLSSADNSRSRMSWRTFWWDVSWRSLAVEARWLSAASASSLLSNLAVLQVEIRRPCLKLIHGWKCVQMEL